MTEHIVDQKRKMSLKMKLILGITILRVRRPMRLVQASHFWVKELWNWSNWVTKELVESKVKKDQNDSWCWCFCIGILNGKWKRQLNIQKCVCVCSDCVCSHSVVSGPLRPRGLYSVGFLRPEYWSGLPFLPPGDLPDSGIKLRDWTHIFSGSCIAGRFFTIEPHEKS